MGRAILIIGAAALAVGVIVYSLIECARTDRAEIRGLRKGGWIAVILLLPLIGALLWLFLGRPTRSSGTGRTVRGRGPDDDPQFLRNIEERRRQQEQAEKLRRWEEQLKRQGRSGTGSSSAGKTGERPGGDLDKELDLDEEFRKEFGDDPDDGSPGGDRSPRD